jgi:hypothetical protein
MLRETRKLCQVEEVQFQHAGHSVIPRRICAEESLECVGIRPQKSEHDRTAHINGMPMFVQVDYFRAVRPILTKPRTLRDSYPRQLKLRFGP